MRVIKLQELEYSQLLEDLKAINKESLKEAMIEIQKPNLLNEKFVKIDEVAKLLNVTRQTIHRYIKRGLLTSVKLGNRSTRIPTEDVKKFIESKTK